MPPSHPSPFSPSPPPPTSHCHAGVLAGRFHLQPPLLPHLWKPPHIWAVHQPALKSVGKQPGRYVNQKVCEPGLLEGSPWRSQENSIHSCPSAPTPFPCLLPSHICAIQGQERGTVAFPPPLFVFTKHPLQPCMNTFAAMRCVSWTRAGEVQEWKSFPPSTPQRFPFPKDSVPFS